MKLEPRSAKELPKIFKYMNIMIINLYHCIWHIILKIKIHYLINVMYLA